MIDKEDNRKGEKMFNVQQYDKRCEPALERMAAIWGRGNKPYKMIYDLLVHYGTSYAVRSPECAEGLLEFLDAVSGDGLFPPSSLPTEGNFATDDLISFVNPSLRGNKVVSSLLSDIYNSSAQRSVGKGELLVTVLSPDAQKAKKHGDVNIGGNNVEMKSDTATINQEEVNKFRKNDTLVQETYGLSRKDIKERYRAWHPLPTLLSSPNAAREFYSKLYRNFPHEYLDIIQKVWTDTSCPDTRSQELGYLVLLDYIRYKGIDGMLLTEQQKCGNIKAVYIRDFSNKEFIFANVMMKPQKMRGGSTEARPDGLVNISIK
jgi:hypothetical protein